MAPGAVSAARGWQQKSGAAHSLWHLLSSSSSDLRGISGLRTSISGSLGFRGDKDSNLFSVEVADFAGT